MAGELDDIRVTVDCPKCGQALVVTYRQLRVQKAAGCSCGALVRLGDDTPLGAVQRLIDEAEGSPGSGNDA